VFVGHIADVAEERRGDLARDHARLAPFNPDDEDATRLERAPEHPNHKPDDQQHDNIVKPFH
jgi:hypothetical protein